MPFSCFQHCSGPADIKTRQLKQHRGVGTSGRNYDHNSHQAGSRKNLSHPRAQNVY